MFENRTVPCILETPFFDVHDLEKATYDAFFDDDDATRAGSLRAILHRKDLHDEAVPLALEFLTDSSLELRGFMLATIIAMIRENRCRISLISRYSLCRIIERFALGDLLPWGTAARCHLGDPTVLEFASAWLSSHETPLRTKADHVMKRTCITCLLYTSPSPRD